MQNTNRMLDVVEELPAFQQWAEAQAETWARHLTALPPDMLRTTVKVIAFALMAENDRSARMAEQAGHEALARQIRSGPTT